MSSYFALASLHSLGACADSAPRSRPDSVVVCLSGACNQPAPFTFTTSSLASASCSISRIVLLLSMLRVGGRALSCLLRSISHAGLPGRGSAGGAQSVVAALVRAGELTSSPLVLLQPTCSLLRLTTLAGLPAYNQKDTHIQYGVSAQITVAEQDIATTLSEQVLLAD